MGRSMEGDGIKNLVSALAGAWESNLRAGRDSEPREPRHYVYASGRRSCVRQMALDLMYPDDDQIVSPDAMERMRRGEEREHAMITRLHHIGPRCDPPFDVVEQQRRFEVHDSDGTLLIRGKIDCRIKFGRKASIITEFKSGQSFQNIEKLEDFERNRWSRHAPDQILSYMFAEGEPNGMLVVDRPQLPAFIPIHLEDHLERMEGFLKDARTAVDASLGGPLPDFNTAECKGCPHFGKTCAPPVKYGEGTRLIVDDYLELLAETRERTKEAAKQHAKADERLKKELRGVIDARLGRFSVRGKYKAKTTLELPPELKAQYQKTDPKGGFELKIEADEPEKQDEPED